MRRRAGYTLLEMLVALAIGALLMATLYAALRVYLSNAAIGRGRVEQSNAVRSVISRINGDIISSLGPADPVASIPDYSMLSGLVDDSGTLAQPTPAASTTSGTGGT